MKSRFIRLLVALAVAFSTAPAWSAHAAATSPELMVFIGTYTGKSSSKGIYVCRLDTATGKLSAPEVAAETTSPSFLAIHPNGRLLYAANEVSTFGGKSSGAITAFAIDHSSGVLKQINQQPSGGADPCYLVCDRSGRCILAANYTGGSVCALPIQADGSLLPASSFIQHTGSSVNPQRQKEPHAHSINVSPDNHLAFAADLGLDKILIYDLDSAKGGLKAHDPAFVAVNPGSGPRHFAFAPDGKHAYVINEISMTVTAFTYDPKAGKLEVLQTLGTVPGGPKSGYSTAHIEVHPSGKFLYGSNRGHNTIAVFKIASDGKLELIQNQSTLGKTPRNFGIDPSGSFLVAANQDSDNVVVLKIDSKTGMLSETGNQISVGSPVCVKFLKL